MKMKKFLVRTINAKTCQLHPRAETRLIPAKTARQAVERAGEHEVVIWISRYEGREANLYIKECKERMENNDKRNC